MDKVKIIFDRWAKNGRADLMQKEHSKTVLKFLDTVSFKKQFTFLDVGCGNGWVVRKISKLPNCKKAIGIDKSKNMIKIANQKIKSSKEKYYQAGIKSWSYRGKFDYVFSMESLYYSVPMETTLEKIYKLLKKDGKFFCGTDFYKENIATAHWAEIIGIAMDLRSEKQWRELFKEAGFKTKVKHVRDPKNRKKWKREFGTLFVIGKKL